MKFYAGSPAHPATHEADLPPSAEANGKYPCPDCGHHAVEYHYRYMVHPYWMCWHCCTSFVTDKEHLV